MQGLRRWLAQHVFAAPLLVQDEQHFGQRLAGGGVGNLGYAGLPRLGDHGRGRGRHCVGGQGQAQAGGQEQTGKRGG